MALAWNRIGCERTDEDVQTTEGNFLELIEPVLEPLEFFLDLDNRFVFVYFEQCAVADLLQCVALGQMKLVLEIVLLPLEVVSSLFEEDHELRERA